MMTEVHARRDTASDVRTYSPPFTTYEIAILLPLRCTEEFPVDVWVDSVNASFATLNAKLFIGVDEDDAGWAACERALNSKLTLAVPYEVKLFPPAKPAIICPIWASLALKAYRLGCSYFVLWGDDVRVDPADWFTQMVQPTLGPADLGCVAPIDVNDPSVTTFPIVTRAHFDVFGRLFSPRFINQDADPYLFELYRRVGRASVLTDARVTNLRGGAAAWPVHAGCCQLGGARRQADRCGRREYDELRRASQHGRAIRPVYKRLGGGGADGNGTERATCCLVAVEAAYVWWIPFCKMGSVSRGVCCLLLWSLC